MLARAHTLFGKEIRGLHQAAYLVGGATLASQVLALFRERLFAMTFGVGPELDVYYAAFRIPDLVFATIASFVSVNVLIPALAGELQAENGLSHAARSFMSSIVSVFCGVMVFVCGILFIAMPRIAPFLAPGFDATMMSQLVMLSRILLLSPFFLGLSNIAGATTQTLRRYVVYSLSPVVYNVGIIGGILFLYPWFGLSGLAWGVICGAVLHYAIQIPVLRAAHMMPSLQEKIKWHDVLMVARSSLPRTLALACGQITFFVLFAIASELGRGAISVFSFAYNLQSVPLAIIGVSYSVVAFPVLSEYFARGEHASFSREISRAARHIIFWSIPIAALCIALRQEIVAVLLGTGKFTIANASLVSLSFALFVVSLVGQALTLLFVRGYYAAKKTARPLFVNICASLVTVLCAYMLTNNSGGVCDISDWCRSKILLLPIAFSAGWFLNALALWLMFRRDFSVRGSGITYSVVRAGIASAAAYVVAAFVISLLDSNPLVRGALAGMSGVVVAWCVYRVTMSPELREITSRIS